MPIIGYVAGRPRELRQSAALEGVRQYRGGEAGGMPVFDGQLMLPGPNPDDEQIDVLSTEGPLQAPFAF